MQTSIFLARLLGPMFVVVGIALLSKPGAFRTLLKEFIESHVMMYLAGFLGLVGGLALLLTHSVWALDWRLMITLIGWATLLRGVVTMFRPEWIVALGEKTLKSQGVFFGAALMDLALGLFLTYFGYLR